MEIYDVEQNYGQNNVDSVRRVINNSSNTQKLDKEDSIKPNKEKKKIPKKNRCIFRL